MSKISECLAITCKYNRNGECNCHLIRLGSNAVCTNYSAVNKPETDEKEEREKLNKVPR